MIGVLALQGDFAEHMDVLQALHAMAKEVRSITDLEGCSHLIIPGGESTVMARLMQSCGLWDCILDRAQKGDLAIFGTCAGAILLASEIHGKNAPPSLGLVDMTIDRNAYGSQLQSFHADMDLSTMGRVQCAFIRAPKIIRTGKAVETLATYEGNPVLVTQGRFLASTFHPEARGERAVHRMFMGL
ncbi:pyridoxal 5'-phosphate synthase glutaminase subunit PdxT [Candidatus Peribacteria bacterium]|nr:pyridoxal 5'-phosphate synthase glutaminase subunit PdxT [Candidatus Peribacteria bacterium]